jgi:YHS domain-containing protein/(2Fe-2S) ferredoxin
MIGDSHGLDHVGAGCPTCDPRAGQTPVVGPRLATVKLTARGEEFRIVQLQGQLMVCARQRGSCCCGWDEKGRMPFDPQTLWGDEWERRKIRNRIHLTFTGCLGPCAVGNNALLVLHGRSIWLKDLNRPDLASAVYDWIEDMLRAVRILPAPDRLKDHVYERFLMPPADYYEPLMISTNTMVDGLDRLDPVCLMDVDPATAKHTAEYAGRTIAFCAPSCKKQFLADPAAYVTV